MELGKIVHQKKYKCIINTLINSACKSEVSRKHSACVMDCSNKKVMSIGINKYHYNKKYNTACTIHAELDALVKTNSKHINGFNIFIIRIDSSYNLKNSRPCNCCIDKLQQYGINKAYYSTENGNIAVEYVDYMPKLHFSSGYRGHKI